VIWLTPANFSFDSYFAGLMTKLVKPKGLGGLAKSDCIAGSSLLPGNRASISSLDIPSLSPPMAGNCDILRLQAAFSCAAELTVGLSDSLVVGLSVGCAEEPADRDAEQPTETAIVTIEVSTTCNLLLSLWERLGEGAQLSGWVDRDFMFV